MKKINLDPTIAAPMSKAEMKKIGGGELPTWTCEYWCDNGGNGTTDNGQCPTDDANQYGEYYCFEGGDVISCVCYDK